jgi:hypothetical protein
MRRRADDRGVAATTHAERRAHRRRVGRALGHQRRNDSKERSKTRPENEYKAASQLRAVVGNVTLTKKTVTVWFVEEPVSTSFRPASEVEEHIASAAASIAELSGSRVYWRVSTRPYAARSFAEATHEDAIRAGNPLPGWADFLEREQRHLLGSSLSEKWVYFGVRIGTTRRYPRNPARELHELMPRLREVSDVVSAYGLDARPANATDMEWLLRRSVGLGLPAPNVPSALVGDYEIEDLPELWEHATWTAEPAARMLTVSGLTPSGSPIERKVAILTMGRMEEMAVPQDSGGGWMQRTDRLDFPVEWSCVVDVLPNDKVVAGLRRQMDKIVDQWKHYTEDHGIDPPESLKRQRALALATEDEISESAGGLATRTEGWYRLAVWGDSDKEVFDKVAAVKKLYGRKVAWWHNHDQYRLAREFIPGEPLANTAARRRMSVTALAAALPAATAEIGDRVGCVLGWTSGTSKRAVAWHPWHDMEVHDQSGVMILAGTLGSGKTVAGASIVYRTVMSGARWIILDPSGRLGALCDVPELRDHARYVNLLKGRDGELNPYRVVAQPDKAHFASIKEWETACEEAAAQRMSLCKDILTKFLPKEMRSTTEAASVLTRAVHGVGGKHTSSPNDVLDALLGVADRRTDPDLTQAHRIIARDICTELRSLASTPKGRLIFPSGYMNDYPRESTPGRDTKLVVYSLAGLQFPREEMLDSGDENPETRMSLALFNLSAWLTQRSIYEGDPDERKGVMIDEGHALAVLTSGRSLMQKSATDSRKHNARIILASQNVTHFDLGDLGNLVGAALVGRTKPGPAADAALGVLGVTTTPEYEKILSRLSKGSRRTVGPSASAKWKEFVFSDGRGEGAERIVFDVYAHPHVLDALNSTPGAVREREVA